MNRSIMLGAGLMCAFAAAVRADVEPMKKLDGAYKVTAITKAGTTIPDDKRKEITVKFKGDEMSLVFPDRTLVAKIKLDASKSPMTIDISPVDGPEKGKVFPGIYKFEKEELIIAFSEKGDRPTEFKGDGDTALMRLKKE